jgi:uncharacterized protein with HEPN domain
MPDTLITERLELILDHTGVIKERMKVVPDAAWFIKDDEGQIIYDSLIARLQAIGENFKKIEKLQPGFTNDILIINVSNIIRFRDLISHHYELLDHQIIFNICTIDIPELHKKLLAYFNSPGNGAD